MEKQEITLTPGMKGIIVHAQLDNCRSPFTCITEDDWIILIAEVENDSGNIGLHVKRHVSYCIQSGDTNVSRSPGNWGYINGYKFYIATDEEKQKIKDILRKNNLKYIRALNKVIDR